MKRAPILRTNAITLVLLPALLAVGCGTRRAGPPRLGEVERLPRLETITLGKPGRLEVVRSYTATVEALEKTDLCAQVKGYLKVLSADIDIGRPVQKDEVLLTLDVPDLVADRDSKNAMLEQSKQAVVLARQAIDVAKAEAKEAEASVLRYEADQQYRQVQYDRVAKLAKGDTVSQQHVDEAQLQLNSARAALTAGKAQVAAKQSRVKAAEEELAHAEVRVRVAQAELERAEVQVRFATVRAPFDGVITKRWVDPGTTVKDAGMPLLTVMRTDKVRVIVDIPERDVPFVRTGSQGNAVELQIPALREQLGGAKVMGAITLTAWALDPVTRTMRAEMHLENRIGDKTGLLKPQMTGTARLTLAVREALTVPASALIRNGNKLEIYIVAEPAGNPPRGIVKRVEVQPGVDDGVRVEIRNERLTGSELIIVRGAGVIRPGDQVIAIPAKALE
jgi:RND family efflux transporter MFP subunit